MDKYDNPIKRSMDRRVLWALQATGNDRRLVLLDGPFLHTTRHLIAEGVRDTRIIIAEHDPRVYRAQQRILRALGIRLRAHVLGSIYDVVVRFRREQPVVYADLCSNDDRMVVPLVRLCSEADLPHMFITFAQRYRTSNVHVAGLMQYARAARGRSACTRYVLMPAFTEGGTLVRVRTLYLYRASSPMAMMHISPGVTETYAVTRINKLGWSQHTSTWHILGGDTCQN